jgi:hypothetical protein
VVRPIYGSLGAKGLIAVFYSVVYFEQAPKQIFFFSRSVRFRCLSMNPALSHAHISPHPLLCGSTVYTAHYHLLKFWSSLADVTWLVTSLCF